MARTVSLATLRSRVRRRSDTESEIARFPDSEVDDCINEGIAQFHAERMRIRPQGFDDAVTTVPVVAGTSVYALPATFLQVTKVYVTTSGYESQGYVYEEADTDGIVEPASWGGMGPAFRLLGNNIQFRPTPTVAATVSVKYVATAVSLSAPSDTIDGVDGFEEYVVAWAAKLLCIKNSDTQQAAFCDALMASVLDRMRAVEHARNAVAPPRMLDVRPDRGLPWWRRGRRLPPA